MYFNVKDPNKTLCFSDLYRALKAEKQLFIAIKGLNHYATKGSFAEKVLKRIENINGKDFLKGD